ncbi:MAG: hypothetical protein ACXACY_26195 [Candidatus Hodarchaeales archaeon]|jgi:hypothetical protein
MRASEVNPQKWQNIIILFENERYSVISGDYEGEHALGERWNGQGEDIGFPSQGGNPIWHVVPRFLAYYLLKGLLHELYLNPYNGSELHFDAINRELRRIR